MNILIATGIYPPEIGGPAEYAKQLSDALRAQGHSVVVGTYGRFKKLPTGIRHLFYFFKLCFIAHSVEYIIALDTFSVGLPAVLFTKIFGKKIVIRIGGDFLWESYVERTHESILLSEFYSTERHFIRKERMLFTLISFVLRHTDIVVFSTEWQRKIMQKPYDLDIDKTSIVENFYPQTMLRVDDVSSIKKVFSSPSRNIYLKNKKRLVEAFADIQKKYPDIELRTETVSHTVLLEKIKNSYAVIVPSFSEVSPNIIFDAFQYGVPVILTKDTGVSDTLKSLVVSVDPLSVEDIAFCIEKLLDPVVYTEYQRRIAGFTTVHTWADIAKEFIVIYKKI